MNNGKYCRSKISSKLLHRFFGESCLNIDIYDNEEERHTPREWFIAPLQIIEQAIGMILGTDELAI
ncbi:hypothetical protein SAMN05216234_15615 [Hydrogenimonas thermophila]|uniref:Uncharacterized protein n=1 Tax=Hydrogenimonas thermophila TaxID=223786 RepID=A0A1I5U8H8_9BACT|nr:hypothetical protein SAMN05216234_15615 [Hydrogenimonas thermophila]